METRSYSDMLHETAGQFFNWVQRASWRTTFFGLIGFISTFIVAYPHHFDSYPWIIDIAKFGMATGFVTGVFARDENKGRDTHVGISPGEPGFEGNGVKWRQVTDEEFPPKSDTK